MNDTTFTDCALTILDKVEALVEMRGEPCHPGWYAEEPEALAVTRTARGFRASVADFDQRNDEPERPLFQTGYHATEAAALVALGIMVREELDEARERALRSLAEEMGRAREEIAAA